MSMFDKMPRKVCPVIFLLDTSGSMVGAPIGALNSAIENFMSELIAKNDSNPNVEIRVAIMTFSNEAKWVVGGEELLKPEDVQNSWNDLEAGGITSMGAALSALNEKLSDESGFLNPASKFISPLLILFMDGEPTDDYKSALAELRKNIWYKIASRVAVGYGAANDDVLREFVGKEGIILHTLNPEEIIKHISYSPEKSKSERRLNIREMEEAINFVAEFSSAARKYRGLTAEELKTILQIIGNVSSRAINPVHTSQVFDDEEW